MIRLHDLTDEFSGPPVRSAFAQVWRRISGTSTMIVRAIAEGITTKHRYDDARADGASHAAAIRTAGLSHAPKA
jgi:hypothetical protein